jgi:group I intron endonuclease
MKSGIYCISSLRCPNRLYIGSTVDIDKRWSQHKWMLDNNKHHSVKLQNHYNKYGKDDLVFSIMFECPIDNLIELEQQCINKNKPYFNICELAGSSIGRTHSAETKKKIGDKARGQKMSNSTKVKMAKSHRGLKHTDKTKHKMSLAAKGRKLRPVSTETRDKISKALMGNKNSLGFKHSSETREKWLNKSSETREKMSRAQKLRRKREAAA